MSELFCNLDDRNRIPDYCTLIHYSLFRFPYMHSEGHMISKCVTHSRCFYDGFDRLVTTFYLHFIAGRPCVHKLWKSRRLSYT